MDFDIQGGLIGGRLGTEGFDQLLERARAICEYEQQRIELANQPLITACRAKYAALLEHEQDLRKRIYNAKPPYEERTRGRRIIYCRTVAAVLIVAGFVLTLLTLEPYQLGYKILAYCLGIAIATPFLIEKALDALASEKLIRMLVTVAAVCSLMCLMTMAVIRGQLMSTQTQRDSPAVTFDDAQPQTTSASSPNTFYQDTVPLWEMVMVLLAFSMEVGAGVALHEAERVQCNLGEAYGDLVRERDAIRTQLGELAKTIISLRSEAARFAAQFWRDFHWAILKRSIANATKVFAAGAISLVLLAFLTAVPARAQQQTELVILIDLSQSVAAPGQDGRTEFQKNIAAVSGVLGQAPVRTHVTVVGITDNSFAQPYILLSATISSDAGYFDEHLAAAHRQLQIAWGNKAHDLGPSYPGTDLLGAFMVTGQIFEKAGDGKRMILVVVSDMRQETAELNLSANRCAQHSIEALKSRALLANLQNSEVYALGVDSSGSSKAGWMCLHDFWAQYFAQSGAKLLEYSVLRSIDVKLR
jgi:hypothetical protein